LTTGEGPKFKKVVRTEKDVAALKVTNTAKDLPYVTNAVSTIRRELNGRVPLIGFSGSPWTLATYMVEGGSSKDFRHVKAMMYNTPEVMHQLLDVLADSVTEYLNAQIAAGAQAVQIFDTWGGSLSDVCYREFSLKYMNKIVAGLTRENEGRKVPVILFTKNGGQWLELMADSGCDALGIDWTTDMGNARSITTRIKHNSNHWPPFLVNKITGTLRPSFSRVKPATILFMYFNENSR
jgi:uroporphyrinogen decarboxylase